jgi:hydrogenase expression/formation protein HypC
MCIGLPGRVTGAIPHREDAVQAEVNGAIREVSVMLLDGPAPVAGDWLVIQLGFAVARITEREAQDALRTLDALVSDLAGDAFDEGGLTAGPFAMGPSGP